MNEFNTALNKFMAGLTDKVSAYYAEHYANMKAPAFTLDMNPKYVRVVRNEPSSRSVHCFIRRTDGAVLKPDGWKGPAPGVRGNIFSDTNGVEAVGPHGTVYFR